MAKRILFTHDISEEFCIARCENVPAGDYLDWPAAPPDAEPSAEHPGLVVAPVIMVVTAGSFEITAPGLGAITMSAGEVSHGVRHPGAHRLTAAEDGSGYVCFTPRDGSWWEREIVELADGESVSIAKSNFACLVGGETEKAPGDLLDGAVNDRRRSSTIKARGGAKVLRMWK